MKISVLSRLNNLVVDMCSLFYYEEPEELDNVLNIVAWNFDNYILVVMRVLVLCILPLFLIPRLSGFSCVIYL